MKDKIAKLIDLKSIITLIYVVTLVFLISFNVKIEDEAIKTLFLSTATSCFTYYFTKNRNNTENK